MPLGWKENIMLILLPACSDGYRKLVITLQSTQWQKTKTSEIIVIQNNINRFYVQGDKKTTLRYYGLLERLYTIAARLRGSSTDEILLQLLYLWVENIRTEAVVAWCNLREVSAGSAEWERPHTYAQALSQSGEKEKKKEKSGICAQTEHWALVLANMDKWKKKQKNKTTSVSWKRWIPDHTPPP